MRVGAKRLRTDSRAPPVEAGGDVLYKLRRVIGISGRTALTLG